MNGWHSIKVGDLGKVVTGKTPKTSRSEFYGGTIPFLTPSDDLSMKHVISTGKTLTEQGMISVKNSVLPADSVCVSCIGSDLGKVIITTEPTVTNQQINSIIVDTERFDVDFVYYSMLLLGKVMNRQSKTSTAVPIINKTSFSSYSILCPDLDEQRRIASILSSMDDKIELNRAINKKLEKKAKIVFDAWFSDFTFYEGDFVDSPIGKKIPSEFQMVQIGMLNPILETGKRPKGGAVADGIPSVGAENVKELGVFNYGSAKFIPVDFADAMKKGKVNGYELMIYKDGGKPGTFIPHVSMFGEGFPYKDFYINEHVFKLDFGDRGFNEFAYFYFQTPYVYNWLAANGGKAAVPGINQNDINSIWIFSPSNTKVRDFCEWVQPLFSMILKNCSESVKLSEMRDATLNKLLGGAVSQ